LDAIVCADNAFDALLTVEEEVAPIADSDCCDNDDTELLIDNVELFGVRAEDMLAKVPKTKKNNNTKSSSSSLPTRKRQEKNNKTAVYDSNKKARQQQRKKGC
jgi:hypothetical protein